MASRPGPDRAHGTGERDLTRRLAAFFGSEREVLIGIGDDAAVVTNRSAASVVCCDPVIEHVHFESTDPPGLVGGKAVNRNLADLAAMGAAPDWLLVSLILPVGYTAPRRLALLRGIRKAAAAARCRVVGGDVAVARGPLVVTVTAIGHLVADRALTRAGARIGDLVHVGGALGGSRRGHHLRFTPPLQEGAWLARDPAVTAAIDVSDGLLLDLATLLEASGGLGAELASARIPLTAAARRLAGGDARLALRHGLEDGEDHVLLWTAAGPMRRGGPIAAAARVPIGTVTARPGLWLIGADGRRRRLRPRGYQHRVSDA